MERRTRTAPKIAQRAGSRRPASSRRLSLSQHLSGLKQNVRLKPRTHRIPCGTVGGREDKPTLSQVRINDIEEWLPVVKLHEGALDQNLRAGSQDIRTTLEDVKLRPLHVDLQEHWLLEKRVPECDIQLLHRRRPNGRQFGTWESRHLFLSDSEQGRRIISLRYEDICNTLTCA